MTPRQRYLHDLKRQDFSPDPLQQQAVDLLQVLYDHLHAAPPPFWHRLLLRRPTVQQGLYLWGGPGRGKTYLMDCFFAFCFIVLIATP